MQENRISIREWQRRYKAGEFNSKARSVQCEAGWYSDFRMVFLLADGTEREATLPE